MIIAGMLTQNNESFISRTIDSIIDTVDKIIVVDGGSTDKTIDILKSLNKDNKIEIIHYAWTNNFTESRTICLRRVKQLKPKWYFQIDSDEIICDGFKNIRDVLSDDYDVYSFSYHWMVNENEYVTSTLYHEHIDSYRMRLWKFDPLMKWSSKRVVHEYLECENWNNSRFLRITDEKFSILHYSYVLNTLQQRLNKIEKYESLDKNYKENRELYTYEMYPYKLKKISS